MLNIVFLKLYQQKHHLFFLWSILLELFESNKTIKYNFIILYKYQ